MIYTVTLNPSIDYIIGVDNIKEGYVNRSSYEKILPGGKGINVSRVLNNLGAESCALGFVGGFTGEYIEKFLKKEGIKTDFINIEKKISRINVKIKSEKETGINALYLAGLAVHESGWNTSKFAEKRNNLFGWQAYDNDLDKTKYFESKGECILFVAERIKTLYLNENGMFHSGYTMESISSRYASDKEHSKKVYKNIEKILDKINQ